MPGGRPPKLELVVDRVPVIDPETKQPTGDMRPVTMIEKLTGDLRVGMPVHRAAKRAGITSETFYQWEKSAGRARTVLASNDDAEISDYDRLCIAFSDAVDQAELEWEARQNTELERLARGGIEQIETVVKVDTAGQEIERRTKTTRTLPDANVLLTRLKLRFPKEYAERHVLAGDTESGAIPVEVRVAALAEAAQRFAAETRPRSRRRARRRLRSRTATRDHREGTGAPTGAPGRSGSE
jgi:hypothetical protein